MENQEQPITFDRAGIIEGFRQTLPIAVGAFIYGVVFGVLAGQASLSLLEALLMSTFVFAGASQLTAIGIWATPLPVTTLILTTLIVNLRHIIMGAALYPWFSRLPRLPRYLSLFFLTDESWALTIGQFNRGKRNGAFLLGSGLALLLAWVSSTGLGRIAGNFLPDPNRWGFGFAFTAVFLTLLVGMWQGRSSWRPWLAAALVAIAANQFLPGQWYILLGGLAGSLVGAWQWQNPAGAITPKNTHEQG